MIYSNTVDDYTRSFREYVEGLKRLDPENAKERATKSLFEAGLLDEKGHVKQNIVNGDFFGWGERNEQ